MEARSSFSATRQQKTRGVSAAIVPPWIQTVAALANQCPLWFFFIAANCSGVAEPWCIAFQVS
jgi:hypothetical protein